MSRVWLITDCASGLGRVLAERVLASGDRLAAGAREPALLADLVAAHAERVLPVALTLTDEADVYAAFRAALQTFGRLDVVVNHAAPAPIGAIAALRESDFRDEFETHFFSAVGVAHAAFAVMQEQGWGHIVQLPALASRHGAATMPAQRAAHAALGVFSQALASEAMQSGIRVSFVEMDSIDECISTLLENRDLGAVDFVRSESVRHSACARREKASSRAVSADVVPFPPRPVAA